MKTFSDGGSPWLEKKYQISDINLITAYDGSGLKMRNLSFISPLTLVATSGLLVLVFARPELAPSLLIHGGFYLMFLLLAAWGWVALKLARESEFCIGKFCIENWKALIFCLLVASTSFFSSRPQFRVLDDEPILVSISQSMVYRHRAEVLMSAQWSDSDVGVFESKNPKRPLLFPFLAYVFHNFLGYQPENFFVLNFILYFFLLCLVFLFLKGIWDPLWAAAAVFLVVAQPVVSLTAASGAYDLCSTLFVLLSFVSLWKFLQKPKRLGFEFLWVNLLLLANTRYESGLYFGVFILGLAVAGILKKDYFKTRILFAVTPLFFLPFLLQRLVEENQFELPPGETAFSAAHFLKNTMAFFNSFVHFKFFWPYATLVNILGLVGLLVFLYQSFFKDLFKSRNEKVAGVLILFSIFLHWALIHCYYLGSVHYLANTRLFTLFFLFLSVLAVFGLWSLKNLRPWGGAVLLAAVLVFALYHPVALSNRAGQAMEVPRRFRIVHAFIKEKKWQNILVIADKPIYYSIFRHSAISYKIANQAKDRVFFYMAKKTYREVLVVQTIDSKTGAESPKTRLDKAYVLETLLERPLSDTERIRISRVKL